MQNIQLIRYITANFSSLRGLRRLPFGIYYLLAIVVDGWIMPHDFQIRTIFLVFSALFIVALVLMFIIGVLLVMSLSTKQQASDVVRWIIFVGYPVLMVGSFALQWCRKDAYGPVPVWPLIIVILFYIMVPGIIRLDNLHSGLNNFALQDWIVAVFLIGSGIYNHLQITRGLLQISEKIHGPTTI